MADAYKRLGALAPSDSLEHVLYTAPAEKTALVSNITVVNRSSSDESFEISVHPGGVSEGTVAVAAQTKLLVINDFITTNGTTWNPRSGSSLMSVVTNGVIMVGVSPTWGIHTSTDGTHWQQRTTPITVTSWRGLAYGNNLFVAVQTTSTTAIRSTDGITWSTTTLPFTTSGSGNISYGAGVFLANPVSGTSYATSTDGITWTSRNYTGITPSQVVRYVNGFFIALTNGTTGIRSTDGITWTTFTLPVSQNWGFFTFGNGRYVAGSASASTSYAHSTNGTTWTTGTWATSRSLYGIEYINNFFYAGQVSTLSTSTDGLTWTDNLPYSASSMASVSLPYRSSNKFLYTNSMILRNSTEVLEPGAIIGAGQTLVVKGSPNLTISAFGVEVDGTTTYKLLGQTAGNTVNGNLIYTVPSGKQALIRSITHSNQLNMSSSVGVSFGARPLVGPVRFVALSNASSSANAAVSTNAISWEFSNTNSAPNSLDWRHIIYANNMFVAISNSPNVIGYSFDGKIWFYEGGPGGGNNLAYGNGVFIASGNSSVARSTDGLTWTQTGTTGGGYVAFGAGVFVILRSGNTTASRSTDGITWTNFTVASPGTLRTFTYGGSAFVALPQSTTTGYRSTDSITWTTVTIPSATHWDIAHGNGRFVTVPESGSTSNTYYHSTDGITWTTATLPIVATNRKVSYGGGYFVVVGSSSFSAGTPKIGYAAYSFNGLTWTTASFLTPSSTDFFANWGAVGAAQLPFGLASNDQYVAFEVPLQGYETLTTKSGYALGSGTDVYAHAVNPVVTTIFGMELDV